VVDGVTAATGQYDLHMHTRYSDGTDSVAEVVKCVVEAKLAGFSITDHDTVGAQGEARRLAAEHGLTYLTGLELSVTQQDNDLHLLLYGYAVDDPELGRWLQRFRAARVERARNMIARLSTLGVELDERELLSDRDAVGRPHIARAMLDRGAVRSIREAFDRYLGVGRPAYLPKYNIAPDEAIAAGRAAGGVAVLAHPASYPYRVDVGALVEAGLQGIETRYPFWDAATTARWQQVARRFDLIQTGGSDYHGAHRPQVPVGAAFATPAMFERLLTARR
jgi:predicted metal-dependent phosphoesterase TrpH